MAAPEAPSQAPAGPAPLMRRLRVLVFIVAGVLSLAVAWLTVGVESVKAAMANPVDALRND